MFHGVLQCWTLHVQRWGTMFYVPQSISICYFEDLNTTIKGNCVWRLIKTKRNPLCCTRDLPDSVLTRRWKNYTIMLMEITFLSLRQVWFPFIGAKYLLAFQMGNFRCEGCIRAYFLTTYASWIGSPNMVALHKRSSLLLGPWPK